jgi:hypothetical protein
MRGNRGCSTPLSGSIERLNRAQMLYVRTANNRPLSKQEKLRLLTEC